MLVDLPTWIGDQTMALPAVHILVEGNRGGDTVLHTTPAMRRLLELLFPATAVAADPRKASPIASARVLCRHGGRFELGVTLRNALRAKILLRLAARASVGSRGEGAWLLLSYRCEVDRGRHQVFDPELILRALGLPGIDATWRPRTPPQLEREGRWALERAGLVGEGRVVGLAPATARARARRWPAELFGLLARRLTEHGVRTVVVVGPGEEKVADQVRAAAEAVLPVVGPDLDVAALVGVTSRLDALVGNDSAPMHLASLFGTRVVGIFGPSDPRRTAPLGEGREVISRNLACAPCTAHTCPLDHHRCMREISVDTVDGAVSRVLAKVGPGVGRRRAQVLVSG